MLNQAERDNMSWNDASQPMLEEFGHLRTIQELPARRTFVPQLTRRSTKECYPQSHQSNRGSVGNLPDLAITQITTIGDLYIADNNKRTPDNLDTASQPAVVCRST